MSDFALTKIEICGFRGFTVAKEIDFGNPLTLLSGGNRSGKSSLLNALEWCFFGPQVAVIKYGEIRERDNWQVKNLKAPKCYVECELTSKASGKTLRLRRTQGARKRTTDFWFELDAEPRNTNEAALQSFLKISPTDFVRAVHLHQEVLRNLVTAKPSERKEAIDRLLGLSDLRETVKSLQVQKPKAWTDSLDDSLNDLSTRLQATLKSKKSTIEQDALELRQMGLKDSDFSLDGALRFATSLAETVKSLAKQYQLPEPQAMGPMNLQELEKFLRNFPGELAKLRSQHPVLKNQGELLTSKSRLEGVRKSYEDQVRIVNEAEKKVSNLPKDRQDLKSIDEKIQEHSKEALVIDAQMQEVSENAAMLDTALDYFRKRVPEEELTCPICGQTSKTVSEWQKHIQSEIEKKHLKPLRDRKEELQRVIGPLEKAKSLLAELQHTVASENSTLADVRVNIEKTLAIVLKEGDDPAAIVGSEIENLTSSLKALEREVESINEQLSEFDTSSRVLDRLVRIGRAKGEIEKIEGISDSQSYKNLKAIRQQCEQYVEDVELLIEGLQHVTNAEAEKRLTGAQAAISSNFSQLTNRPDFPGLRVIPSQDGYLVVLTNSTDTQEALPILNQGDLNCAALSIFLALATAPEISHKLGFVILDDPSQSLDTRGIGNLCKVLGTVCDRRQLIVATTDEELRDGILKIAKTKKHYLFRGWDPAKGPDVEMQAL